MGLSASQARLLSLTARQSNLEYEGQQINQQRTSLSNASSNYYNNLLEMKVPVPPSTNDYTKIVYTFTIGGNEATLKEALPISGGSVGDTTYVISFTTSLSTIGIAENESYKTSASAKTITGSIAPYKGNYDEDETAQGVMFSLATMNRVGTKSDADKIKEDTNNDIYVKVDGVDLTTPGVKIIGPDGYEISKDTYNNIQDASEKGKCKFFTLDNDNISATETRYMLSYAQIPNQETFDAHKDKDIIYKIDPNADPSEAKKGLFSYKSSNEKNFTVVDPQYSEAFVSAGLDINAYYQYESTSGIRFVKREDVEGNLNNQTRSITTSAVATIKKVQENTMSNARIEFDSQGRISTVTDEDGHTYTMTATTEKDEDAYDDAYNQYEYNQYIYDQKQSEINANIKILQAQDKSLELRLSNLDTQHSAIQTELEAVKKVMSKNIENSFKTFNA